MATSRATDLPATTGTLSTSRPRRHTLVRWPLVVAALAWALALLATLTGQRYLIDHHWLLEESGLPFFVALAVFVACWQVMTAGMMLPSSLPMLTMMTYAARKQSRPRHVLAAFVAAYAVVWTGFAVFALIGDSFIHRAVDTWPWLAEHWQIIGAGTFALAGLFQFSPLKERCLTACRSPFSFFVRYYRAGTGGAWRLGLRHGLFCLGCCWALMLIMFGVGVGSLAWMAGLAGVMILEKTWSGGRRLAPYIGVALLLLAALWLVQPAWLGGAGV